MMNKNSQTPSRIPIRFVDEDASRRDREAPNNKSNGELSPEEIGRASIYEDETEVQRRIDRGPEQDSEQGRERADDEDIAGAPYPSDLPERREDQDTTAPSANDPSQTAAPDVNGRADVAQHTDAAAGPMLAELLATRAELRRVETELQKLTSEHQELLDRFARRQADFENYRKRLERERSETYNRIVGEVVNYLLPVMDNLNRALDAEASAEAGQSEEFRHFLHGVELIRKQLNGVLEKLGVQPVATVGRPFDPHVHEAIATEETDEFEPDTVTQEIVRGYRLGDKLLRPAMVKVATKP